MKHPYATEDYVSTLTNIGRCLSMPEWGSPLLTRQIDPEYTDICGVYPFIVLNPMCDIDSGLVKLKAEKYVSLSLTFDNFHRPNMDIIEKKFSYCRPFKTHLIHYMKLPSNYSSHHRYYIKQALKKVNVEEFDLKSNLLNWISLYENLTNKHNLGINHLFTRQHFQTLSHFKEVKAIGAWIEDRLVSAHLFIWHGDHVQSHLAASSEEGYSCGAAYAVNDYAIRIFKDASLINFGGGAGAIDNPHDGLFQFKKGFANATSPSYICGVILNRKLYENLSKNKPETSYFPAYRATT